jgi:hypothetical protein
MLALALLIALAVRPRPTEVADHNSTREAGHADLSENRG